MAIARPMLRAPPVTSARRPSRRISCSPFQIIQDEAFAAVAAEYRHRTVIPGFVEVKVEKPIEL
jgi:hypothetical protein